MFDAETVGLIKSAPPLEGLNLDGFSKELTLAYSQIVSFRIRLKDMSAKAFDGELGDIISRLGKIAHTQEALVAVSSERTNRASAAFVSASAHQLTFNAERLLIGNDEPSKMSASSIAPEIASTIMFLIAGRAADAAQMAKNIRFANDESIEEQLRRSITELARGQLQSIVDRVWKLPDDLSFGDDTAVQLLWFQLLRGLRGLASRLLGNDDDAPVNPLDLFALVRSISVEPVAFDGGPQVFSVFTGPHHLASLLHGASDVLTEAGVMNIEAPPAVPGAGWIEFLGRLARRRPYLWPNHREAIKTGYLVPGNSAVVSFPTGAGKSTLAELKIAATRLLGQKVVFLAPTNALVDQVTSDLKKMFPEAEMTMAEELEPEELTDVAVMTPEHCLTLLGFSPAVFKDVGLLVFDECHLLHPRESLGRRSIDAMLCLLQFVQSVPDSDLVLISAMVKNAEYLASWIEHISGRVCLPLTLSWKPTRQARGCVVYPSARISALQGLVDSVYSSGKTKAFPAKKKASLTVKPVGMFSLLQTWSTMDTEDYALLPLLDQDVHLSVSKFWRLTANRNDVAARIASGSAGAGMKTLVFAAQPGWCASIEAAIEEHLPEHAILLTEDEKQWLSLAQVECGGVDHTYSRQDARAASHHGLLLPVERQFAESLFKRADGIHALVATSTLAQGMNLPSQVVIIAGDDRFDKDMNKAVLLEAHELLNAAGRAGRAGEAAEGLVILVPGKIVDFDEQADSITGHWFELQRIFENSDQCLEIEDPLEALLDRLHQESEVLTPDEAYLLRRLPFTVDAGEEPARRLLQNSLAAFKAKTNGDEEWIANRIESAIWRRKEVSGSEEVVSWEDELASSTGVLDGAQIRALVDRFYETVGEPLGSVLTWLNWGFEWLQEEPQRLGVIIRPLTIESVFGAPYSTYVHDAAVAAELLQRIRKIVPLWIEGVPLNEIQTMLPTKTSIKCNNAREWGARLMPELAYFFGVSVRTFERYRFHATGQEPTLPFEFAKHAQCLREGFDHPDKLALRYVLGGLVPRVVIHHRHASLQDFLEHGSEYDSFHDAVNRVRRALRLQRRNS